MREGQPENYAPSLASEASALKAVRYSKQTFQAACTSWEFKQQTNPLREHSIAIALAPAGRRDSDMMLISPWFSKEQP